MLLPEWGNLDILEACGASDSGSNPGSGVSTKVQILELRTAIGLRRNSYEFNLGYLSGKSPFTREWMKPDETLLFP